MDIVIIGGGIAAAHAARELREHGHEGGIVVLAAERHLPYERPPLSKGILLGDATPESAHVMEQHWYDDNDVDLRTGTEVTSIDLDRRQVHAGAASAPYDRLLVNTKAPAWTVTTAPEGPDVATIAAAGWAQAVGDGAHLVKQLRQLLDEAVRRELPQVVARRAAALPDPLAEQGGRRRAVEAEQAEQAVAQRVGEGAQGPDVGDLDGGLGTGGP